jgi:hypothetical protein
MKNGGTSIGGSGRNGQNRRGIINIVVTSSFNLSGFTNNFIRPFCVLCNLNIADISLIFQCATLSRTVLLLLLSMFQFCGYLFPSSPRNNKAWIER